MPHDPGTVLLVGAGPGAADLLTLRATRAIGGAEALLYDALVDDEVIALAPPGCVRIRTGKRAGKASLSQDEINRLMLRLAREGRRVVRLKGGDPSVFGRSGEERAFLEAHGVRVEIVPGVTAAAAAAAQFAFPLTHRNEARRLTFATARVQDGQVLETGWAGAGDAETTLALYMGRDSIQAVADRLIAEGRAAATPALAVENAGRSNARMVAASLVDLPAALSAANFDGPVVVLVGEVTARAKAPSAAEPHCWYRSGSLRTMRL
jgi:uroporphyrin-III C-methyltransferase